MFTDEIPVLLKMYEIDLIKKVIESHVDELKKAIESSDRGEVSLMESIGYGSEIDAEFLLDSYQKIVGELRLAQGKNNRNDVEFVDQANMFRPEQEVELFRIRGCGIDQVVYVFKARRGYYLIYETLEELVNSFLKDRESKLRFESSIEVDLFLVYWSPVRS